MTRSRLQHPPRVLCPWCAGSRHEYRQVAGAHTAVALDGSPLLRHAVIVLTG